MSDRRDLSELLAQARQGDDEAREALFTRCRSYVEVVSRAQVGTWLQAKVDSSDLVQQTLLEAHRGFTNFQGETEGEWLAWLRRIVQHNAVDFVRRYRGTEKRQANREVRLEAAQTDKSTFRFEPSDDAESPSQFLLRQEREIEVADAITQLAPDYQEVILLRNVQRLPFEEIGERMDRSRPAVQMLWMRALKKLGEILKSRNAE